MAMEETFIKTRGRHLGLIKKTLDYVNKKKDELNRKNTEIKNKFKEIAKLVNNKKFTFVKRE